jgi:hypothetical protein
MGRTISLDVTAREVVIGVNSIYRNPKDVAVRLNNLDGDCLDCKEVYDCIDVGEFLAHHGIEKTGE